MKYKKIEIANGMKSKIWRVKYTKKIEIANGKKSKIWRVEYM